METAEDAVVDLLGAGWAQLTPESHDLRETARNIIKALEGYGYVIMRATTGRVSRASVVVVDPAKPGSDTSVWWTIETIDSAGNVVQVPDLPTKLRPSEHTTEIPFNWTEI